MFQQIIRTRPKRVILMSGLVLFFCLLLLPCFSLAEEEDASITADIQTSASDTFAPATAIKNYYVDPYTGSANFTIPINLPPARKNLPLKLNLVYSSRARNGWLGVGWKLDLGVIERSTKDGYPK